MLKQRGVAKHAALLDNYVRGNVIGTRTFVLNFCFVSQIYR
jgi:hypothetical protein